MKSIEDQYHLNLWLTSDQGYNGIWSKRGAIDGMQCDDARLNDWDWLYEKFQSLD